MANFVNIANSAQNFTTPLPFQHFTGDYATATTSGVTQPAAGTIPSANACDAACKNNADCEFFKFSNGTCQLFNSGSSTVLSGIKINTSQRGVGMSNIYSTQLPNTTAKTATAATNAARSVQDCEAACNSDATCFVYGYNLTGPTCSLYGSANSAGNVGTSRDLFEGLPTITLSESTQVLNTIVFTGTATNFTSISPDSTIEILVSGGSTVLASGTPDDFNSVGITLVPSSPVVNSVTTYMARFKNKQSVSSTAPLSLTWKVPATISAITLGTTPETRTQMNFTITLTNPISSDLFRLELSNTYTPTGLSAINCTRTMATFEGSSLPTQIAHDENIPGGTVYKLSLIYDPDGTVLSTSANFAIPTHLTNTVVPTSSIRAIYSSLRVHPTYQGPLFNIEMFFNGVWAGFDIHIDSTGQYRVKSGSRLELIDINVLDNTSIYTIYNQTGSNNLSYISVAPLLLVDGNKFKFYIYQGSSLVLPRGILATPGAGGYIINIKMKNIVKTKATGDRRLIMGSGVTTTANTGPWIYLDINNKPAITFNTSINSALLTTSAQEVITNDPSTNNNNYTFRILQNPFKAWITRNGTTLEPATPTAGIAGSFLTSTTVGQAMNVNGSVGGSVTLSPFTSLAPDFDGEFSSIFVGVNNTVFNFEASPSGTTINTSRTAMLKQIRGV